MHTTHVNLRTAVLNDRPTRSPRLRHSLLISGLALSLPTLADNPSLALLLDIGGEYDSNVSVVELDHVANAADWASTINLGAKGLWAATDKLKLRVGAFHDRKHYREFDEFDLDVTRANAEASYDFRVLSAGVSHDVAQARLDQQQFMQLSQTSLFASKLINHTVFLRGQFTQQRKTFDDQPQRDASQQSWGGDLYWFTRQGNSYLSAGLSREAETAQAEHYSYDGLTARARWSHNLTLAGLPSQTQLGWRFVDRDYRGPALVAAPGPSDDAAQQPNRADRQHHWEAKWNLALNNYVTVAAKVSYADYQSNLSSANYQETVTALQLQTRF